MFESRSTLDRAWDALLAREVRNLNSHLPKQRRTLSELLKDDDPAVNAVDGSSILVKKAELEELAKIVPREYHDRLKLPLIVIRRMELGKSVYSIAGERIEEFTVKRMLGMTNLDFHQMYSDREPGFLYKPLVVELIRRFHSIVVMGFSIPRELTDYAPSRD